MGSMNHCSKRGNAALLVAFRKESTRMEAE